MSEVEVSWRLPEWFPEIEVNKLDELKVFFDLLAESNKRMDLVSPRTIPFADLVHFADGIKTTQLLMGQSSVDEIYDFGSGAGFPGMVLAILHPEIRVFLVEANSAKASFLKWVQESLGLKNVEIVADSVANLAPGSVKTAIARGFGPIAKVLLSTRRLFPVGGRFFHVKGEEWATEVSQIPSQLCVIWKPSHIGTYSLPGKEATFTLVKTEKVRDK